MGRDFVISADGVEYCHMVSRVVFKFETGGGGCFTLGRIVEEEFGRRREDGYNYENFACAALCRC